MDTQEMDIVYTFKMKPLHDELKYSLRSLKNLPHSKVWIFGDCPDWVNQKTVNWVECSQAQGNKWLNVADLLEQVVENEKVSDDFIWFNDDFFVLKEVEELNYFCDRTLGLRVADFYKLGWPNGYTRRLLNASRALKWNKYPTTNYELHIPFIFNKEKLKKVMEQFPQIGAKRSLYGNCYVENPIQRNDCKIYNNNDVPTDEWDFLSTSDEAFITGKVGKYIRSKFKKKCEYECD